MKPCLADVNVLLPLMVMHHEHHDLVSRWFENRSAGEVVLCRFVQLALIRLLGNRAVMGDYAVPASRAWELIAALLEDERVDFGAEPLTIETALPGLLRHPAPAGKLVGDAYLAAFSIAGKLRLSTIDRGFRQFANLDLDLLVS